MLNRPTHIDDAIRKGLRFIAHLEDVEGRRLLTLQQCDCCRSCLSNGNANRRLVNKRAVPLGGGLWLAYHDYNYVLLQGDPGATTTTKEAKHANRPPQG